MFQADCLLMRHGETEANANHVFQTDDDLLTPLGQKQIISASERFWTLLNQGVFSMTRDFIVHLGPAQRHERTWDIAAPIFAAHGITPHYIQKRQELAERLSSEPHEDAYAEPSVGKQLSFESWPQMLERIHPYVTELEEKVAHSQILCIGSGGSLGMMKMVMEHGLDGAHEMVRHDRIKGPQDENPQSSQWYLNKVPNASIDICDFVSRQWKWQLRILP